MASDGKLITLDQIENRNSPLMFLFGTATTNRPFIEGDGDKPLPRIRMWGHMPLLEHV
jgi:hypothetical protein